MPAIGAWCAPPQDRDPPCRRFRSASSRTTITGQGAWRTTSREVLPSSASLKAPCPCAPMTTAGAFCSPATRTRVPATARSSATTEGLGRQPHRPGPCHALLRQALRGRVDRLVHRERRPQVDRGHRDVEVDRGPLRCFERPPRLPHHHHERRPWSQQAGRLREGTIGSRRPVVADDHGPLAPGCLRGRRHATTESTATGPSGWCSATLTSVRRTSACLLSGSTVEHVPPPE